MRNLTIYEKNVRNKCDFQHVLHWLYVACSIFYLYHSAAMLQTRHDQHLVFLLKVILILTMLQIKRELLFSSFDIFVTPGFKNKTRFVICVPRKSTPTATEYRISETMLYSENILIISTYIRV
jgi:hypothetical protein